MALLDIRNLNIEIQTPNGRMKIVDSVNLSLNEGEILGLVGESGSGKTTIGKIAMKLHTPTEGTILYNGEDVTNSD